MDDPWNWDVERVVQELCTPNRPWLRSTTSIKLPPLDKVEAALREHEVDGELLLTYDQAELCAELGIKILKHKSTFKSAIHDLRLLSNQYRTFKRRQASEFEEEAEVQPPHPFDPSDAIRYQGPIFAPATLQNSPSATPGDEPPPKKRRIAPVLITTEIDHDRNRTIATEADTVRFALDSAAEPNEKHNTDGTSDDLHPGAYLGNKSFTRFDIIDFDPIGQVEPVSPEDKEINHVSTSRLIPGRMIQTHRIMKRHLLGRPANKKPAFSKPDIVPGSNNPDHDKLLPLYGDSDDDMEYDSATWKEIEDERLEREKEPPRPQGLTIDEINSTFERVIEQFASEWRSKKLPKYASKANNIWNNAKRFGLKDAIDRAQRDLREFETRIAKWKDTLCKNEYRHVGELESSLASFEPSVFDREHRLWLISVLTSPLEPAKISRPRELKRRPSKPQHVLVDDEETLTSESEDDLRGFVVEDELNPMMVDDNHIMDIDREDSDADMNDGDDEHSIQMQLSDTDRDSQSPGEGHSKSPSPLVTPTPIRFTNIADGNPRTPLRADRPIIIDLTTPTPSRHIIHYKDGKLSSRQTPKPVKKDVSYSPLFMDITDLTSAEQKVAQELASIDQTFMDAIFTITRCYKPEDIWMDLVLVALDREWPKAPYNDHVKKDGLTAYTFIRLFETYREDVLYRLRRYKNLDDKGKQRVRELYTSHSEDWAAFVSFLFRLSDRFEWTQTDMHSKKQGDSITSATEENQGKGKEKASLPGGTDNDTDTDNITDTDNVTDTDAERLPPGSAMKKKKKRKLAPNREAAIAREMDQAAMIERDRRRKLLRKRLVTEGNTALGSQQGSIIVNESKSDDQGFIYIHHEIASRIKEHQVQGVQFMWDQLIVAKKRQGCLLAHTMGLGKTMQIITLLVTIGEASASDDPSVSSQIPEELRKSKTLILCPATLVNNWTDEMDSWLPRGHRLGTVSKVDAIMGENMRAEAIETWDKEGGILIIGYNLFKLYVNVPETHGILLNGPNIVVADEAHMMKNQKSQVHLATANFKTLSRVALTGSPLANNVEEYYSMINWVAPNYLGEIKEFRAHYAIPIKEGLDADSTNSQRRKALRMLRVLKAEVAPKVSRITIAVLKKDIPMKKEFVITVPLTAIQRKAYELFINYHKQNSNSTVPVFAIHDLALVCASPLVFLEKLKEFKYGNNTKNQGSSSTQRSETAVLPQQLISDGMTLLGGLERTPDLDEFSLSWKIPILLKILVVCKEQGDYVLLFSHSKLVLDYLEKVLRRQKSSFLRLDGQTPMADRQDIVKDFNKGNIDLFLISTKAGSLGLNITGANRVIIFDTKFNPQDEQQAVGRAYRIGQKKPVYVYRFVCGGTLEQQLLNQAIWKMQLASRVVDRKNPLHRAERFAGAWDLPEEPIQEDLTKHIGQDKVLDAILKYDAYTAGIRAIKQMDIFEEEAVEEAELSAEDRAMADQIIAENEARRSGKPLPEVHLPSEYAQRPNTDAGSGLAHTIPGLNMSIPGNAQLMNADAGSGLAQGLPGLTMPVLGKTHHLNADASSSIAHMIPGLNMSVSKNSPALSNPFPQPSLAGPSGGSHPVAQASSPGPRSIFQSDSPQDVRPQSGLDPVQIPGAEVFFRPATNSPGGVTEWTQQSDVTRDVLRAFNVNAGFPDILARERTGNALANAIWDAKTDNAAEWSEMKWLITYAIANKRFVEALCMGFTSPQQLVHMTKEDVIRRYKALNEIDASTWETKKATWKSQQKPADPKHLQIAMNRISAPSPPPKSGESSSRSDPSQSKRLDDQKAIQAVFERRRLKTQQNGDKEALQAVLERRKAQHPPHPSSSDHGQQPRLPQWGREAIRQAQIQPPSSSIAPPTIPPSSSPAFPLPRQNPRTPFN